MPLLKHLPADLKTVHIMGIAGTAMGALAGMLKDAGYEVSGSDTGVYPPMSDYLHGLSIDVMTGFLAKNLDHKPDLVVVGNVIRAVYEEAVALVESPLSYCSLPQLLGELYLDKAHSIVCSGTHGKTTTTAITAWLFESAGKNPGFLIGGIAKNFDRTARAGGGEVFVIEGDEYDTAFFDKQPKFLHYKPNTCILTSVEFDHADIYRDLDHVKESFRKLMAIMPSDGLLIVRGDCEGASEVAALAECDVQTYGPGQMWDGRIDGVDTDAGTMQFTVFRDGVEVGTFSSILVGEHNLYNQVAATASAMGRGLTVEQLQTGFSSFLGIKRRQEVIGEPGGVTVVDDFAHHPTAVRVTLDALRQRFGPRRLWAVWEPRSATSRRSTFQKEYGESFDAADQIVIASPYDQSRIEAASRFSSETLVQDLSRRGKEAIAVQHTDDLLAMLAARVHSGDVVAILSNGGFEELHGRLLTALEARFSGGERS